MEMVAKKMIMNSSSNNNEKQINKEVEEEDDHDVALPGFRFHPTDEELVGFYLRRKVDKKPLSIELIKQIDIYKYDPWDLPKVGNVGDKEWYFFCIRGRKYRNSIRPNRVTGSGFWKATGIDKPIYSVKEPHDCIGLKKSLVYYCGSAGKGTKTDWMMHEFRLPPNPNTTGGSDSPNARYYKVADDNVSIIAHEAEVWTLCRIFKRMPSYKKYDNNTNTPTDHNNNIANKYVPSLETTPKKSSSISSLSTTTTPVDDSSSKTCSLETTDYTNTDKSCHVNSELNSDHHHHYRNHRLNPQEVLFSQRNKRSKPVDRDRDCETSSTTISTNTANTSESWFDLGPYNVPQIGLPHRQHQAAPIVLPGSSYHSFSLNPNPADHDFFTNGSWDELTSVVQLAVDRNPSQLNDITDKLQQ